MLKSFCQRIRILYSQCTVLLSLTYKSNVLLAPCDKSAVKYTVEYFKFSIPCQLPNAPGASFGLRVHRFHLAGPTVLMARPPQPPRSKKKKTRPARKPVLSSLSQLFKIRRLAKTSFHRRAATRGRRRFPSRPQVSASRTSTTPPPRGTTPQSHPEPGPLSATLHVDPPRDRNY